MDNIEESHKTNQILAIKSKAEKILAISTSKSEAIRALKGIGITDPVVYFYHYKNDWRSGHGYYDNVFIRFKITAIV